MSKIEEINIWLAALEYIKKGWIFMLRAIETKQLLRFKRKIRKIAKSRFVGKIVGKV